MGVARHALRAHVALSVFSAVAFATFLVPPIPEFFRRPTNQAIMDFSYRFGGQTTVVLGAVAAIWFLASAVGWRRTLQALATCFVLSFAAEAIGTTSGYPFGPYIYTERLGFLIAGLVLAEDGSLTVEGLKANIDVQFKDGVLKEPLPTPDRYADHSYVRQAQKELGL